MENNFSQIFIDLAKYSAVTILVVAGLVTSAAIASSENLKAPDAFKFKTVNVQVQSK